MWPVCRSEGGWFRRLADRAVSDTRSLVGRDREPSCLYVIRHVQLTYARRQLLPESGLTLAEQNVVTASKPPQPIAGGLPGPGLLAQALTSKYADHIPLNRFQRISARHGVELSRQTTCGWAMPCVPIRVWKGPFSAA